MSIYEKIALYACLALMLFSLFKGCREPETSDAAKVLTETFLKENKKILDSITRDRKVQEIANLQTLKSFIDGKNVQPIINKYTTIYEKINTESDSGQLILLNELVAKHKQTFVTRD
jgi:hypothetical protein